MKKSPLIKTLCDHTINQIAAGEVIESPASVIKELVENSVDAGATRILVTTVGGGFRSITVSDNGHGMDEPNLEKALLRHATSKIRTITDMDALLSMGFRGEALASIAAISKMSVTTKPSFTNSSSGAKLVSKGGKMEPLAAAAREQGTTTVVEHLFYNVPARRAFQKGATASTREIIKLMTKLALAHPRVAMELICDGALRIQTEEASCDLVDKKALTDRIHQVLGEEIAQTMIAVDTKLNDKHLMGFLGTPASARATRSGQYLFVNHRPVVSPFISKAIYDALGTRLASGEHPCFILHLTLPSNLQDVNVHPQKKEIRFKDKAGLYSWIFKAVESALGRMELSSPVQEIELEQKPEFSKEPTVPLFRTRSSSPSWGAWQESSTIKSELSVEKVEAETLSMFTEKSRPLVILGHFKTWAFLDETLFHGQAKPPYWKENFKEGMVVFDVKKAQQRTAFEEIIASLKKGGASAQALLVPKTLEYAPHEMELVEKHTGMLAKLGIELRSFGKSSFIVEALKEQLDSPYLRDLVLELANSLEEGTGVLAKKQEETLALLMVGHIKALGKGAAEVEIRYTFEKLMQTTSPYYSPKGEAIFGFMGESDLEQLLSKPHRKTQ